MHGPAPGLCASCRHARVVVSGRGSRFVLCERSRLDPRFPRYPPLPVVRCVGFEEAPREGLAGSDRVEGDGETLTDRR